MTLLFLLHIYIVCPVTCSCGRLNQSNRLKPVVRAANPGIIYRFSSHKMSQCNLLPPCISSGRHPILGPAVTLLTPIGKSTATYFSRPGMDLQEESLPLLLVVTALDAMRFSSSICTTRACTPHTLIGVQAVHVTLKGLHTCVRTIIEMLSLHGIGFAAVQGSLKRNKQIKGRTVWRHSGRGQD